jgi:glutamate-1-semialdehyde 2,1-aminomutase
MALGAVALGYGHPAVNRAATDALAEGVVAALPPVREERLAAVLATRIPWLEQMRFLKTGAEAVAAAVRIARTVTGRDLVLGCGYHGWHDWCQGGAVAGVPGATRALFAELPFNDPEAARAAIRERDRRLAAVVLVFDEIKTAFRLELGGAAGRYGVRPDLAVLGKALGNGFPLAVVGGRADVMAHAGHTWISSTLATESVALAAAEAVVDVFEQEAVPHHLHRVGTQLLHGFHRLRRDHPSVVTGVAGVAEMCFLVYADDAASRAVAAGCARRGQLLKRTAYNFVSLAHDDQTIDATLGVLDDVVREVARAR